MSFNAAYVVTRPGAYDGLIELSGQAVEENAIGHFCLSVEAPPLFLLRHEALTTGPELRGLDRCCFP